MIPGHESVSRTRTTPVDADEDPVTPSRRERKKDETRARIHRAAVTLVLERGMSEVTVEEIATVADVSPRTFFNYFATKEDALVGSTPGREEAVGAAVRERPEGESVGRAVRIVLTEQVQGLEKDPELWRMRRELAARSPELAARIAGAGDRLETALVEAAYARAGTDPAADLTPGLTARTAMAAVRAAFHQHRLSTRRSGTLVARLDAAFDAAGIGVDRPGDADPAEA